MAILNGWFEAKSTNIVPANICAHTVLMTGAHQFENFSSLRGFLVPPLPNPNHSPACEFVCGKLCSASKDLREPSIPENRSGLTGKYAEGFPPRRKL